MSNESERKATNITWDRGRVTREERWQRLGLVGVTLWFTGLSGSGKSTVAAAVEAELLNRKLFAYRLDGDNVRHGLNANLGFGAGDRNENIRRVGEVSKLFADAGAIVLAAFISPYRADRQLVRRLHEEAGLKFLEVHVATSIEVCESRDPKGLYRKARAGQITGFTGVDDPYEPPDAAELVLDTGSLDVSHAVQSVLETMRQHGVLS